MCKLIYYEEKVRKFLNDPELTVKQRETLGKFVNTKHRASARSKLVYVHWLRMFIKAVGKEFDEVTREDIDSYLSAVKTDGTYNNTVTILKKFYKKRKDLKLNDEDEGLKHRKYDMSIPTSELLTPEEVVKLANATGNEMLKSLVLTGFESCARMDKEVLGLKVGDVEFSTVKDNSGKETIIATLHFSRSKGKVLKQPVVISMFAYELKKWLETHPHKDNPQAYLFYSMKYTPDASRPLSYPFVHGMLKRAGRVAEIKKRVNPHWLRHSMLSYLSNVHNYNEQLLMWRAGWKNTAMAKRYIHSGAELENSQYLERQGYIVEKKEPKITIKPKPCLHCNNMNPYTNLKCDFCGMPLNPQEYEKELKKRQLLKEFDPEEVIGLKEKVERLEDIVDTLTEVMSVEQVKALFQERKDATHGLRLPEKKR